MIKPYTSYITLKIILDAISIITIIYTIQTQIPEALFAWFVFSLIFYSILKKSSGMLKKIILRFEKLECTLFFIHVFTIFFIFIMYALNSDTIKLSIFDFKMIGFILLLSCAFQLFLFLEVKNLRHDNELKLIYSKSTYALLKKTLASYFLESIILCILFLLFFFVGLSLNIEFLSAVYIFFFFIILLVFLLLYTRNKTISELFLKYKLTISNHSYGKVFLSYVIMYFILTLFILFGVLKIAEPWGSFLTFSLFLIDVLGCVIPKMRRRTSLWLLQIEWRPDQKEYSNEG